MKTTSPSRASVLAWFQISDLCVLLSTVYAFSKAIHMCIFFLTSVRGWENVFLIVIWPMSKHNVMGFWRPQRTDVAITDVSRKRGWKKNLWFIHFMEWERNEFTETKSTQRIVVKFTAKESFALDDGYLQFTSLCSRRNNWLPKSVKCSHAKCWFKTLKSAKY